MPRFRTEGADVAHRRRGAYTGLVALVALLTTGVVASACKRASSGAPSSDAGVVYVDDAAPAPAVSAEPPPAPGGPEVAALAMQVNVFDRPAPAPAGKKIGYLRIGARVVRDAEPAGRDGCPGGWYRVRPRGFVCVGDDATLDVENPIVRAAAIARPDLRRALPYMYAFVRAVAPLYLKVPTEKQQLDSEFKLKEHLAWWDKEGAAANRITTPGALDFVLDERGAVLPEAKPAKLASQLGAGELFGGEGDADPLPFWLQGGRQIPNVSDFVVGPTSIFANRVRRHTGLALVGSFPTGPESLERRFAITTDLRLVPGTKIKPDAGSPWHGVEITSADQVPFGFVRIDCKGKAAACAPSYRIDGDRAREDGARVAWRAVVPLSGKTRRVGGSLYRETRDGRWMKASDLGVVAPPAEWPAAAKAGQKWIEVSIGNQTLVLWEGDRPVFATLVSTGQDGAKDPKTTKSTIQGTFRIRSKHVTATMDSNERSSQGGGPAPSVASVGDREPPDGGRADAGERKDRRKDRASAKEKSQAKDKGSAKPKASAKGSAPAKDKPAAKAKGDAGKTPAVAADGIVTRDHPEYGKTVRRGQGSFELRDVPWVEYFEAGYALHAAYWHDVFGIPRSHGCVNLSPLDAHRVFLWTEPGLPDGWHGVTSGADAGEGTVVVVHE